MDAKSLALAYSVKKKAAKGMACGGTVGYSDGGEVMQKEDYKMGFDASDVADAIMAKHAASMATTVPQGSYEEVAEYEPMESEAAEEDPAMKRKKMLAGIMASLRNK